MNNTNLIIPLHSGYRDFISPNLLYTGKENSMKCILYNYVFTIADPSGRPRGLRLWSAAARLLGFRVPIRKLQYVARNTGKK